MLQNTSPCTKSTPWHTLTFYPRRRSLSSAALAKQHAFLQIYTFCSQVAKCRTHCAAYSKSRPKSNKWSKTDSLDLRTHFAIFHPTSSHHHRFSVLRDHRTLETPFFRDFLLVRAPCSTFSILFPGAGSSFYWLFLWELSLLWFSFLWDLLWFSSPLLLHLPVLWEVWLLIFLRSWFHDPMRIGKAPQVKRMTHKDTLTPTPTPSSTIMAQMHLQARPKEAARRVRCATKCAPEENLIRKAKTRITSSAAIRKDLESAFLEAVAWGNLAISSATSSTRRPEGLSHGERRLPWDGNVQEQCNVLICLANFATWLVCSNILLWLVGRLISIYIYM